MSMPEFLSADFLEQAAAAQLANCDPAMLHGDHSDMNVFIRTGWCMFFPERDPGDYTGRHRK